MGYAQAAGYAACVAEGISTLENAVAAHLQSNHYPPVPDYMVGPCLEAIDLANGGAPDAPVSLPHGTTWRDQDTAPAWAVIDGHHLHAFLEEE